MATFCSNVEDAAEDAVVVLLLLDLRRSLSGAFTSELEKEPLAKPSNRPGILETDVDSFGLAAGGCDGSRCSTGARLGPALLQLHCKGSIGVA